MPDGMHGRSNAARLPPRAARARQSFGLPACLAALLGVAPLVAAGSQERPVEIAYASVPIFQHLSLDGAHRPTATDGGFLVLDRYNHRVLRLDPSGAVQGQIGQIGQGEGELRFPMDYAIAADGGLSVVTAEGLVGVHAFTADGGFAGRFHLGSGGDDAAFFQSFSIAVDSRQRVFLSQPRQGDLVTVYSRKGRRVGAVGELLRPDRVFEDCSRHSRCRDRRFGASLNRVATAVTRDDSLVVAFTAAPVLRRYSAKGELAFDVRLVSSKLDELARIAFQDPETWSGLSSFNTDGVQVLQMIMDVAVDPADGRIHCLVGGGEILVVSPAGEQVAILVPGEYGRDASSLTVSDGVALLGGWSRLYRSELPRIDSPTTGAAGGQLGPSTGERGGGAMQEPAATRFDYHS